MGRFRELCLTNEEDRRLFDFALARLVDVRGAETVQAVLLESLESRAVAEPVARIQTELLAAHGDWALHAFQPTSILWSPLQGSPGRASSLNRPCCGHSYS